jgi:hypothetical protein
MTSAIKSCLCWERATPVALMFSIAKEKMRHLARRLLRVQWRAPSHDPIALV